MKTITDTSGKEYILSGVIGKGGQGKVWRVQSKDDGKFYAYKVYKHNKSNIRQNIEKLIEITKNGGFKDKDGNPLSEIIPPLEIVSLEGDSFGYIMELVDLGNYITLLDAWSGDKYPSCRAICRIIRSFAGVFETLHLSYGMCYKDVNEGNIYFNPDTGDLKIIDNDNVGYSDDYTIKGTSGYMAPEVILGSKPNHNSDRFSLAVFVYRLLVGGRPFEGPYTRQYCEDNDILPDDAAEVIFGADPVFVWHPSDHRNSIVNETSPRSKSQAASWNNLPESVKDLFVNVFVTNIKPDRCAMRADSDKWIEVFRTLEENLLQCPSCGKFIFQGTGKCFECSYDFTHKKHEAVLKVMSLGEERREISIHSGEIFTGREISKHLPQKNYLRVLYNKHNHKIGIQNLSGTSWTLIHSDKTKEDFRHGEIKALEAGMMIRIIPKKAQLNVISVY